MNHFEASLWLINMAPHPCLLDIKNYDCHTALHMAVMSHEPTIVRRLVLAGANTSIRTMSGDTALHIACTYGDFACAKALLEPFSILERNWLATVVPNQTIVSVVIQNLEVRNYVGECCSLFLLRSFVKFNVFQRSNYRFERALYSSFYTILLTNITKGAFNIGSLLSSRGNCQFE